MGSDFVEDEIQELYAWVDTVPLSRPKRNIARDFSDGVLMAETVSPAIPSIVRAYRCTLADYTGSRCAGTPLLSEACGIAQLQRSQCLCPEDVQLVCSCLLCVCACVRVRVRVCVCACVHACVRACEWSAVSDDCILHSGQH